MWPSQPQNTPKNERPVKQNGAGKDRCPFWRDRGEAKGSIQEGENRKQDRNAEEGPSQRELITQLQPIANKLISNSGGPTREKRRK
jgi:hypothetical protein